MSFEKISVVGLGYVGLPLALEFAKAGLIVYGIEQNPKKVEMVNKGISYIDDVKSEELSEVVNKGVLKAFVDFESVKDSDAVIICVPTPLGAHKEPDISYIVNVTNEISKFLKKGQLIVLESTTYPGTTEEVVLPILEKSGLKGGEDFYLAFSPERVDPGNKKFTTKDIPKVVGGINEVSTEKAAELYSLIVPQVHKVSSPKVAEMEKLLENIFRLVNISFINELAILCGKMGIDVWEVIEAASTKPYGFMPFYPGPGLGGHCLLGKEKILVKNSKISNVYSLEELFKLESKENKVYKIGDLEVLKTNDLFVNSLNDSNLSSSWMPVSYLFKRKYKGDLVKIITEDNRKLIVTEKHPMLRLDNGNVEVVEARDLKVGDLLPLFKENFKEEIKIREVVVDLIKELSEEWENRVRVKIINGSWVNYKAEIYSICKTDRKYDYIKGDYLPLGIFRRLEREKKINIEHDSLILLTGRGPSTAKFPAVVKIDKDLARFIGYYLSEGCATKEREYYRIRLTINKDEKELFSDIESILNKLGLTHSIYLSPKFKAKTIRINSPLLGWLLIDRLRCGKDSYSMRIPDELMSASLDLKEELLKGLFRGDGDIHYRNERRNYIKNGKKYNHRNNSLVIGYFSISDVLFYQIIYLLQEMGIYPSISKNKNHLKISGYDNLKKLTDWFLDEKGRKYSNYFRFNLKKINNKRNNFPIPLVSVKEIEFESVDNIDVYSLEVENTHTFAVGSGIYVHNCIPIDPFYLSWKAKEYDLGVRFIELAGEINDNMPRYIVQLVMEALNKHKKAVNGSKILIIGVAYKPNVGDPRESPALKIIPLLEELNGEVEFYDPYISEIKIENNKTKEVKYMKSCVLDEEKVRNADCVLIITDHDNIDYEMIFKNSKLIVDTRNALRKRGIKVDDRVTILGVSK
ncbi:MAG: nucleotide sugar dehydrogenase [Dictyoglomus thermophilum]|nr:nucleotide sugar dehydrogenase [Dictyoglomus thermophilum]MCX7720170.1 nucleotide sugar dehydrogenase [Dictyoglomus thermophilum]TYT23364.1 nucleotide sugar dehydrogenase [Dictyoglomus thermophilum]